MMFTVGYDHDNLRLSCEGRSEISEKNDYSSMLNISGSSFNGKNPAGTGIPQLFTVTRSRWNVPKTTRLAPLRRGRVVIQHVIQVVTIHSAITDLP